jgi:DNA-binding response OmpR family regulator
LNEGPPLPPGLDAYRPAALLGSTVLVVDDEKALREQLTKDLEALGYHALEAAEAGSTRRILLSEQVDGIVLDLLLGEGDDGFELLEWIHRARPEIPVTVLSATKTASAHIRRAYELGAASYFVKGNMPLAHLYSDLAARMLEGGGARLATS